MPAVLTGLTTAEASRRLTIDGPKQLPARRPSPLRQLGRQLTQALALGVVPLMIAADGVHKPMRRRGAAAARDSLQPIRGGV